MMIKMASVLYLRQLCIAGINRSLAQPSCMLICPLSTTHALTVKVKPPWMKKNKQQPAKDPKLKTGRKRAAYIRHTDEEPPMSEPTDFSESSFLRSNKLIRMPSKSSSKNYDTDDEEDLNPMSPPPTGGGQYTMDVDHSKKKGGGMRFRKKNAVERDVAVLEQQMEPFLHGMMNRQELDPKLNELGFEIDTVDIQYESNDITIYINWVSTQGSKVLDEISELLPKASAKIRSCLQGFHLASGRLPQVNFIEPVLNTAADYDYVLKKKGTMKGTFGPEDHAVHGPGLNEYFELTFAQMNKKANYIYDYDAVKEAFYSDMMFERTQKMLFGKVKWPKEWLKTGGPYKHGMQDRHRWVKTEDDVKQDGWDYIQKLEDELRDDPQYDPKVDEHLDVGGRLYAVQDRIDAEFEDQPDCKDEEEFNKEEDAVVNKVWRSRKDWK